MMVASEANIQYMQKRMGVQMISYDKVNQLRHVLYLQDRAHTLELMARHGRILEAQVPNGVGYPGTGVGSRGLGHCGGPKGGYFCLVLCPPQGWPNRALELCKEAGVVMTAAGAIPTAWTPGQQHSHRPQSASRGRAGAGHDHFLPVHSPGRTGKNVSGRRNAFRDGEIGQIFHPRFPCLSDLQECGRMISFSPGFAGIGRKNVEQYSCTVHGRQSLL